MWFKKKKEKFDINKTRFILQEQEEGYELQAIINVNIFNDVFNDKITCIVPKYWCNNSFKYWEYYGILPTQTFYIQVKTEEEALKQKEIFLKEFKLKKLKRKEI